MNTVTKAIREGNYILIVYVSTNSKDLSKVDIEVEFQSENGFPSKYPNSVLLFYDIMCLVYVLETIVWFVLIACNWKNILRIHHLMSLVLLVSVLDSIFDAIHHDMMNKWVNVNNADVILDIIVVFQTSLCLFFMILFSLGDGITKPKLGRCPCTFTCLTTLFFFIFSSCLIVYINFHDSKSSNDITILILAILVVLFGLVLVIWIGNNLIKTIRFLQRENNIGKMILYICVTIGLVLYALSNIASIALYFKQANTCSHAMEILISEGIFVPVTLSAFLLFVIVLIRPTSSNLGFLRYEIIYDKSDGSDMDENVFERHKLETVV
ncbi:transmembrane protein 87B-like [Amphiura filiformis]|uniref:transmembrane protein 87B-like n=1 Tax=Amphiura filiformis TaxID=82378 RepID=UPI003B225FEB